MMRDMSLTAAADSKRTGNNSIAFGSELMSATGAGASEASASSLGAGGSDNTSIGSVSIEEWARLKKVGD